ncbi:MAG: hypothetical protein AAF573_08385 [Bacteroidota bacterium]
MYDASASRDFGTAGVIGSNYEGILLLNFCKPFKSLQDASPPLAGVGGWSTRFFSFDLKFHPLAPASGGEASCKLAEDVQKFNSNTSLNLEPITFGAKGNCVGLRFIYVPVFQKNNVKIYASL